MAQDLDTVLGVVPKARHQGLGGCFFFFWGGGGLGFGLGLLRFMLAFGVWCVRAWGFGFMQFCFCYCCFVSSFVLWDSGFSRLAYLRL